MRCDGSALDCWMYSANNAAPPELPSKASLSKPAPRKKFSPAPTSNSATSCSRRTSLPTLREPCTQQAQPAISTSGTR